jgi:hypothetical protein
MEKIFDIIVGLLKDANWGQILGVLMETINTFLKMIGKVQ